MLAEGNVDNYCVNEYNINTIEEYDQRKDNGSMKIYNIVMPVLLIISLICMAFFTKRNRGKSGGIETSSFKKCPEVFVHMRRIWYIDCVWWLYVNYAILMTGFLSSMMVLYINATSLGTTSETIIYSIIAASMTVFGYVVAPRKYARACKNAYMTLECAMLKYERGSEDKKDKPLIDAALQGIEYINHASESD